MKTITDLASYRSQYKCVCVIWMQETICFSLYFYAGYHVRYSYFIEPCVSVSSGVYERSPFGASYEWFDVLGCPYRDILQLTKKQWNTTFLISSYHELEMSDGLWCGCYYFPFPFYDFISCWNVEDHVHHKLLWLIGLMIFPVLPTFVGTIGHVILIP